MYIRKSPTKSAKFYSEGTQNKGNDGNMWIVTTIKNDVKRWKKITNNSTISQIQSNDYIHLIINTPTNEELNNILLALNLIVQPTNINSNFRDNNYISLIIYNTSIFKKIESFLDNLLITNPKLRYLIELNINSVKKMRTHLNKKGKKVITKNPTKLISITYF